jgi:hypothetical protein
MLSEKQMDDRLKLIKKAVRKVRMQDKKLISKTLKATRELARKAKKVGDVPSSLEAFDEKNMYWTEKETSSYLEGTSYHENYSAMKSADEWN